MKNIIVIFLLHFFTLFILNAQPFNSANDPVLVDDLPGLSENPLITCGTDYFHQLNMQNNSIYRAKMELFEQNYINLVENGISSKNSTCDGVYTVPIVIHVVYGDDANGNPLAVGQGENLSDADIQLGIDYLNAAFAGNLSCHSDPQEDTGIQFCLAKRDINDNSSNGINRYYAPNLTDLDECIEDEALKNLSQVGGSPNANAWPSTDYINVWLVKEICVDCSPVGCAVAGYSTLAGAHGSLTDGFVNEAGLWSSTCDNAKVGVHELGHYFNLYHTFQGGCTNNDCLVDGDKVCDTPPDNNSSPNSGCGPENTCQTDGDDTSSNNPFANTDVDDLRNNYMDYGTPSCHFSFSAGQRTRMRAALCGIRSSLLSSAGCLDPCSDPVMADFTASTTTVDVNVAVNFTNTSTGTATYEWLIDEVSTTTTTNLSHTFSAVGNYTVCLIASSPNAVDCLPDEFCTNIEVVCPFQVTFEVSQSDVQPGDMVTFTNTTAGGSAYEWFVDGVSQGAYVNPFTHQFNDFGGFSVCLKGSNGDCETTACQFINVGSCGSGKQGAIWYFGAQAGLDFNSGTPVALTDGELITFEGCATYSDNNGNLLFYTDGSTVWDKNHNVMPNGTGLNGTSSSTQSAIIIPIPETTNRFYIFTVDQQGESNGVQYSEVDLNLNNGLGDITGTKNIPLLTPSTEKITAIPHCNGEDIWVLTREWNSDAFYSYLVTNSGVSAPVVTNIGLAPTGNAMSNGTGYLKASPDGSRVAAALLRNSLFELYDFDNTTGILSNYMPLKVMPCIYNYGVEFSPDGSKLYGTCSHTGEIYQFDLSAGSTADILSSAVLLSTLPNPLEAGALQLGIDGKIYIAGFNKLALHRINLPNATGLACDFEENAVSLGGKASRAGLPNIFPAFFIDKEPIIVGQETVCGLEEQLYTVNRKGACDASIYELLHLGNATVLQQVDTAITLSFPETSVDTLISIKTSTCGTETDTLVINIAPAPTFDWMDSDTLICLGSDGFIQFSTNVDSFRLTNTASGFTEVLTQPIKHFDNPQADSCYQLQLIDTMSLCEQTVDFCVYVNTAPFFEWGITDTTFCLGEEGSISFNTNADSLRLINQQTGDVQLLSGNTAIFSGHQADSTYTLHLIQRNTNCDSMLTFTVDILEVDLDLGPDVFICAGEDTDLEATITNPVSYSWSPSQGLSCTNCAVPTANPTTTTTYIVEVENTDGCLDADTITVTVDEVVLELGDDQQICSTGESVILDATIANPSSYSWSPPQGLSCTNCAMPTAMPASTTTYTVTVTNGNGCQATDDITVEVEVCCPTSVADFTNTVYHCASEGAILPTVPDTNVILSMVDAPDNATMTWSTDPTVPISYTGDGCTSQSFTYMLTIGCTDDSSVALDGGTVTITIYPEITATNNTVVNDGGCGPTLTVACSNYTVTNSLDNNGSTPDWSGISGTGTITFVITNPAAQANGVATACQTEQLTADYACCATTVGNFTAFHTWCASETPQLPPVPSDSLILSTIDVADQVQIVWSTDPTIPIVYDYTNGGCEPQVFTYNLTITCATNPNVALDGGTIRVTVYPEIDGAANTIIGGGTCAVSIDVACANYVVTNDFDQNGANPDWTNVNGEGEITFTVSNPLAPEELAMTCLSQSYATTYKCCIADVGDLKVTDQLCPLEDIVATTNDEQGNPTHQLDSDYAFQYLLLNENGILIEIVAPSNNNEVVFDVPPGTYGVCGFSYQLADAPNPMPSLGGTTSVVGSNVEGCYELTCWHRAVVVPEDFVWSGQNIFEGDNGGVTPFHYNSHEIIINGGTRPYSYTWDRVGYVRSEIRTQNDGTGEIISINYHDQAEWALSVTDAHGCTTDVAGTPLVMSNNADNDGVLDIYQADITPTVATQTNGAIDISIRGGDYSCGVYECVWYGPHGMTATTEDLSNLSYGWYRVNVTDCAGEETFGWYWVANTVGAGSGFIRGKQLGNEQAFLQVLPNPAIDQSTIQFQLPTPEQLELSLYYPNGQLVKSLFVGNVEKGQRQIIYLDVHDLASGVYIVQLMTTSGTILSDKLVVVK